MTQSVLVLGATGMLGHVVAERFAERFDVHAGVRDADRASRLGIAGELTRTAAAARLHDGFGYPFDVAACRAGARTVLRTLDDHLAEAHSAGRRWLAGGDAPTIADVACFPYAALAPEGGIALDEFPALRRWLDDFRMQPRFVGMAGIMAPALSSH